MKPSTETMRSGRRKPPSFAMEGRRTASHSVHGRLVLTGEAGDEALAAPQLAIVAVHLSLRDNEGSLVIVGVEPFAGCDLPDPVEAVKPVSCHFFQPEIAYRRSGFRRPERIVSVKVSWRKSANNPRF